jgi:hypothetical protein
MSDWCKRLWGLLLEPLDALRSWKYRVRVAYDNRADLQRLKTISERHTIDLERLDSTLRFLLNDRRLK